MSASIPFDEWCVVELLGHVRMAGRVTEEQHFGSTIGRIDIPIDDAGGFRTKYFGGGSIYRVAPCSEAHARIEARHYSVPANVHPPPPRDPKDADAPFYAGRDDDDWKYGVPEDDDDES